MSELRDSRLDDFLITPTVLGVSVGDDALPMDCGDCCGSRLSRVSSTIVGGIDGEVGVMTFVVVVVVVVVVVIVVNVVVDTVRRGGRRFFGRTEIR